MGGRQVYNYFIVKESLTGRRLVFLVLAVIIVAGLLLSNRIFSADAFTKEEGQHALYGYWLLHDLNACDLKSFFYDTQRQMVWPFLHSWILSFFFIFFGASMVSARLLSLFIFVASLGLMYLLSRQFSEEKGDAIGTFSILLALTSPLMLRFATENMLEGLGGLLFLAVAYGYTLCEGRKITAPYIILAMLMGLSIYTNYLYAYLLIPAYLVATLSNLAPFFFQTLRLSKKGEKAAIPFIWWTYRKMIVLVVLLLFAALWFSFSAPRKIMLLLDSIFRYSGGVTPDLWQGLIFYPKIIIDQISFSPWLGLLMLVSLFLPFIAVPFRGLDKLFIYVWTTLLLLTLTVPTKAAQLIYVIMPFIFIISATAFLLLWERAKNRSRGLATGLVLAVFCAILFYLPNLYAQYFPNLPKQNMAQVLAFFRDNVPRQESVAASLNLTHLNPENVQFAFRGWEKPVFIENLPEELELYEKAKIFLTVDMDRNSRYATEIIDDSLYRWNALLRDKEKAGKIRLRAFRKFEEMGVTAKVYQRLY